MSTRKTKIVAMTVLSGAALVVACGGGSGSVIDVGAPYDQQGGAVSDNPTASDRDPSPARGGSAVGPATGSQPTGDNNGTSGTSGGTSGATSGGTSGTTSGGTSGTTAGCPPCDGSFTCDVTVTGQPTQKTTVMLTTKNGACTFSSQGGDVVFACGGTLTASGQPAGTWANCVKAATSVSTNPDAG